MKFIGTLFLTASPLLAGPLLSAQHVRVAPAVMPARVAPMTAPSRAPHLSAGSFKVEAPALKINGAGLSAPIPIPAPRIDGSAAAFPGPSAPGQQTWTATPAAASARTRPAPASSLRSLEAAAEAPAAQGAEPSLAAGTIFDGAKAKADPKEWTFMVFLNGHNNLDRFGAMNIKQMERVGSNDRVNIIVQWASLGKPTRRMLIQRAQTGEASSPVIESLPPADMGSADELSEFIRWTVERFPAQRYMVDVWDHGAGWHVSPKKPISPLDISYDDLTGHSITTEQLGEVMRKAQALIGRPIDVLGFDACLMAMAEVVAEVADSVRYVAGSEESEPGEGWPYDKILQQWLAAPPDDGTALVKAITEQFVRAYSRAATFSALDARKLPAFIAAAKPLSQEIAKLDAAGLSAVRKAALQTRRYAYWDYGDFLDFVLRLAKQPAPGISAPVLDAAAAAFRAMVVANGSTADRAGSNGMSVWLPTNADLWQTYAKRYLALVWHRLSQWGDAVRRLAVGDPAPSPKV